MIANFSTAVAAFRSGRLREAESRCRDVLSQDPSHAEALNLLGVIAGASGNHKQAAELMKRAVTIAPAVMEYRRNLARALMREEKLAEAEEVLRPAIAANSESPQLLGLWGAVIGQRGNQTEGIVALRKAVELAPYDPSHHFNLAELYRRDKQRDAALTHLKKTVELAPNYTEALNNLAGMQLERGEFMDALGTLQRLLQVNPRSAQAYCNLGVLMGAAGDAEASELALRNAVTLAPNLPRAHFHLANQLVAVGKLDEAEQQICALRDTAESERLSVKLTHAKILERKGDITGAAAILDSIDEEDRSIPDIAIICAIVLEQQGKAEEALALLESALEVNGLAALEGIYINFTLGDVYDSLGRYDEAFASYKLGNENRKRAFFKFDRAEKMVGTTSQRLTAQYEPEFYRRCPTSTLETDVPIFILGMPRSGTSLLEQILASHSQVFGAGELTAMRDAVRETYEDPNQKQAWSPLVIIDKDPSVDQQCMIPKGWSTITAEQLSALGSRYLGYIRKLDEKARRITDKMPYNFILVPLIAKVFPHGKIIHTRRHPLDTCLSCYFQNFTGGSEYSFDLAELGKFYRNYLDLMKYWRDTLQVPMLEVDYERLVRDPESNVRAILDYCELEWEDACMNFHKSKRAISTASYQQVRKPIYTRSAGRWRNYGKHLDPLIEALGIDRAELEA
jgi:tetratricopeptide (TPR) repeat protein